MANQCLGIVAMDLKNARILVPPKAFAMLRYLVEHGGRLVTGEEMLEALLPETYVQPEVLKSHNRNIRAALGDDAKSPRFIETLPQNGYRFNAQVNEPIPAKAQIANASNRKLVGRDRKLRIWRSNSAGRCGISSKSSLSPGKRASERPRWLSISNDRH